MDIIYFIVGVILGGLAGAYLMKLKQHGSISLEKYTALDKEKSLIEARFVDMQTEYRKLEDELKHKTFSETDLRDSLIRAQAEGKNLMDRLETQKKDLLQIQETMTLQFQQTAKQIMDRNSEKFSQIQQERIGFLLNPLKEKISTFEKRIEDTYKAQHLENGLLKNEIQQLASLNQQMSEDAKSLTKALKGDNKVQGDWGEVVLERIMERSGLKKDSEYVVQGSSLQLKDQDGKHLKPDVVVLLPEGKHLIIDAKASLKAFEAYIRCEETEEQKVCLKQHVASIKNHIRELGEKYYQNTDTLKSPDFVLMFLPIEASFSSALQYEQGDLFNFGWERKVVIVSPTTLLATLKTVASIWKNEKQNRNALKIAEESGRLYDKFHAFVGDLEKIGKSLQMSQSTYDDAMKKLAVGKGNLLSRAEKLKSMGINNKKSISSPSMDLYEEPESPGMDDLSNIENG